MTSPVDLETVGKPSVADRRNPSSPHEEPYNSKRAKDKAREDIAKRLLWCLTGVVAVVMLIGLASLVPCYWNPSQCVTTTAVLDATVKLVTLVLTPLVGLVGAATGFYFGERSTEV